MIYALFSSLALASLVEEAAFTKVTAQVLKQLNYQFTCDQYAAEYGKVYTCLLYTSPSPRDRQKSRMPSSA